MNATNSASDRVALNKEVSQLIGEITRIGDTTSFNGLKMLDGTYTDQVYQVGANVGETISISLGDARASALGATESTSTSGTHGHNRLYDRYHDQRNGHRHQQCDLAQ